MLCHEDEVKLLRYVLVRIKNKTTLQHSGSERYMFHKKRSQCVVLVESAHETH